MRVTPKKVAVLFAFAFCMLLFSAAPKAAVPTVEQILDKYLAALGGRTALLKITSRVATGTIDVPAAGATGTFQLWAKAPNKMVSVIHLEGRGDVRQGCDGKIAWELYPQSDVRELSGQELSTTLRAATFYAPIHIRELYGKLTVKGTIPVDGKDAWLIESDPGDGTFVQMYFDAQSGLLVRRDLESTGLEGHETTESFYSDFREVDGIKLPFVLKQIGENNPYTLTFQEYKDNVPLDDALFARPTK